MQLVWEFQLTNRTLQMLDRPYYIRNRVNALSCCMFMCDVTFVDNWVWWPGYRQENQGIVVQLWGGNRFVSCTEHPYQPCKQPTLLSIAEQRLFLLLVKRLVNIVLKLRMNGEIPPLPYAFMSCRDTTLISRKVWVVRVECKRKDINCSKHITRREQRH
jgi:hypothetical protein